MHSFSESSCHVLDTLKYMNHIFVSLWQFQHLQVKKYPEFDCSGRSRVRVRARAPFFFAFFFFRASRFKSRCGRFFSFFGNLVFFLHPSIFTAPKLPKSFYLATVGRERSQLMMPLVEKKVLTYCTNDVLLVWVSCLDDARSFSALLTRRI